MRILYVEDNALDADLARREFARTAPDISMEYAQTYADALARLEQCTPEQPLYDVMLTDMHLPDGNGLSLLPLLQERGLPIAVVVLTGVGSDDLAVAALKAGASDYVVKRGDYLRRLPDILATAAQRYRAEVARRARPLRVLYVEPDAAASALTRQHFAQVAPFIHLEVVSSADAALRMLPVTGHAQSDDPDGYDVLLLTYRLPRMNGLELLKELVQGRALDLPIVFVTGKGDEEIAVQALRLGALDYVGKHEGYLLQLPALLENAFHRAQVLREQAALKASEEYFRVLIENAADLITVLDEGGTIRYASPAITQILGYVVEELVGTHIFETIHPDDVARVRETLLSGETASALVEARVRHKDGSWRYLESVNNRRLDKAGRIIVVMNSRDVTMRKQTERQLERYAAELERSNQELEQFAYVASHDLQEPLRMVTSYVQLLERRYKGRLDDNANKYIAYAVDGAMRMQQLIQDLLAYSRVNRKGAAFVPTNCTDVVRQVLANLAVTLAELRASVTYDKLPTVLADTTQLTQLFQNLIGNALKFHSAALPLIHISAQPCGSEWLFAMRDNGIGIDPQYAERIFVIFQRLHTQAEYPGTGMGLAICKRIVERHHGCIWVESTFGQGATFYFTIPREAGTHDEAIFSDPTS